MFSVAVAYRSPRLIAEPAREIIYKRGHRLVLPCHAVATPQPTYDSVIEFSAFGLTSDLSLVRFIVCL